MRPDGVEGILPDGLVGEILDKYVVPHLRKGNYDKGLSNAVVAVSSVIAKDAEISLTGSPATYKTKKVKEKPQINLRFVNAPWYEKGEGNPSLCPPYVFSWRQRWWR